MKWISTDDKLPETEDLFLIGQSNGDTELARWDRENKSFIKSDENGYDYEVNGVVYWLPIPDLPKLNSNNVGCPMSSGCPLQGCYRYFCCDFPNKRTN